MTDATTAIDSRSNAPGATPTSSTSCRFLVWAPGEERLWVHQLTPEDRFLDLAPQGNGYHSGEFDRVPAGSLYRIHFADGRDLPDPASRYQPEGLHGPSQVVSLDYRWSDGVSAGIPLADYIIYELHIGTFSEEGTFAGAIGHIRELVELGVTAVEVMPVAQFPGKFNWGYDGAAPYTVDNTYGNPKDLLAFVDACHIRGLAVILDVVYNHLGPEGNYLTEFGPYFTDRYNIFWGDAINFDGPGSDDVRRYFIENALMWLRDYRVDALRLDAVHAIFDQGACHFIQELGEAVRAEAKLLGREVYLIAETDLNAPRIVTPVERGGYGMDAQWNDDFHHALHTALTGEDSGYYADYVGLERLASCFRRGYSLCGEYSAFRKRRHGVEPKGLGGEKFVVCSQNHDQVGNRAIGDRLSNLTTFEGLKLAAAATLLSPFVPLLFMGEEYGETAPFLYFVDYSDEDLRAEIGDTRKREFAESGWSDEPPNPISRETFERSRLQRSVGKQPQNAALRSLYRQLISIRKESWVLSQLSLEGIETEVIGDVLLVRRPCDEDACLLAMNFGHDDAEVQAPPGWPMVIDTADERWAGPGSHPRDAASGTLVMRPQSLVLLASVPR